jgi:hypothetical protein
VVELGGRLRAALAHGSKTKSSCLAPVWSLLWAAGAAAGPGPVPPEPRPEALQTAALPNDRKGQAASPAAARCTFQQARSTVAAVFAAAFCLPLPRPLSFPPLKSPQLHSMQPLTHWAALM